MSKMADGLKTFKKRNFFEKLAAAQAAKQRDSLSRVMS